jgi:eukaryotic-like serine/threonine-protein kinase
LSLSAPTREGEALDLLEAALEQPEAVREAWLTARTEHDPELRRRVLRLLRAAQSDALLTGGARLEAEPPPPERVGDYRIVERIGRGGMGAVYRAERDVGDFHHVVAIKLIRPGVLSEALVERFQRERQTLASLSHPHIARLFGGGETADGQPFIVMEFVAGRPLTEWARSRGLPLRERVRLFVDACEAVRFAHQNLIIHRDLTPGNVLVTDDGAVKLIDFGIARPAEAEGAEPSAQASLAGLTLTPGFAAPERMAGAGSSTLVDVYSLGRLLDALLGDLPADPELTAVAAKAAAGRPEARYPSVDALIEDLEAWRTGHPVSARGGGRRYALGKFVGRHRRSVTAGAAAITALVAAFALTLAAYGTANRARTAEAQRFNELRSLAGYMLFQLNGDLQRVPGNTRARVELANEAQRYLSALARSAGADDDLRREAARGLTALAYVQGVPGQPNLGEAAAARRNLTAALEMLPASAASDPDRAGALTALSLIEAHVESRTDAAADRLRTAEAALGPAPSRVGDPRWLEARSRLRRAQLDLAVLQNESARLLPLADRLEREAGERPAADAHDAQLDRAIADHNRSIHGYMVDDLAAGVEAAERAERRLLALDRARPNDPEVLFTLAWTAYIGFGAASGLPGGAERMERFLSLAEATTARLLALDENDRSLKSFTGQIRMARSQALSAEGRHDQALAAQTEVTRLFEASLGPERRPAILNRLANAQFTRGRIALNADERATACESFRQALAAMTELQGRGELVPSVGAKRETTAANVTACDRGGPLSTNE